MNDILHLSDQTSIYIYNQGNHLYFTILPFSRVPQVRLLYRGFLEDFHACTYQKSPVFLFKTVKNQVVLLHNLNQSSSFTELVLLEPQREGEGFQNLHLTVIQDKLFFFYTVCSSIETECRLYIQLPFEQTGAATIFDFHSDFKTETEKNKEMRKEIIALNKKMESMAKQYNELYEYSTKLQGEARRLNSILINRGLK